MRLRAASYAGRMSSEVHHDLASTTEIIPLINC